MLTGDTLAPGALYTNNLAFIPETGTEGILNDAIYTPTTGQPGFDASGPTYHFISDGTLVTVPEPSTLALTWTGLLVFAALYRRRRVDLKSALRP